MDMITALATTTYSICISPERKAVIFMYIFMFSVYSVYLSVFSFLVFGLCRFATLNEKKP